MSDRLFLSLHLGMHPTSGSIFFLLDERRRSSSEIGTEERSSINDVIARCSDRDGLRLERFYHGNDMGRQGC